MQQHLHRTRSAAGAAERVRKNDVVTRKGADAGYYWKIELRGKEGAQKVHLVPNKSSGIFEYWSQLKSSGTFKDNLSARPAATGVCTWHELNAEFFIELSAKKHWFLITRTVRFRENSAYRASPAEKDELRSD